jgi:hypothetical protein
MRGGDSRLRFEKNAGGDLQSSFWTGFPVCAALALQVWLFLWKKTMPKSRAGLWI